MPQRGNECLTIEQGIAFKIADWLKVNGFPDARTHPSESECVVEVGTRQSVRGYTVEAAAGQFVIVQPENTVNQQIINGLTEKALNGELAAIAWLEDKGIISFEASAKADEEDGG